MDKKETVLLIELLFFLATLILGVIVSSNIANLMEPVSAQSFDSALEESAVSPIFFIGYFLLATLVIFLVAKTEKFKKSKEAFFKAVFLISVTLGSLITLSIFFSEIVALFIILILLFTWQKRPLIILHNTLIVLSVAGIGAMMGAMFPPFVVVGLLVFFSVYDFIAVYKTKHMVKMATEMVKTKAIMGLVIPFSFSDLIDDLNQKQKKEFIVLGGGDLAFPLFLVSAVTIKYNALSGLVLTGFSALGLLASFFIFAFQKKKRPIPALPPIALFSIIGFLVIYFL